MALSEQEQKLLEQLEASLSADDPKLAENLRGTTNVKVHRRRATLAGLGFTIGLVALVIGIQIHPAVSVLGFLIMLAAVIIGIGSYQRVEGNSPQGTAPKTSQRTTSSQDFMDKLEERWRNRQEGGGF